MREIIRQVCIYAFFMFEPAYNCIFARAYDMI